MLWIVKYIKANGLENAVKNFNLVCREYDSKVLLKYNQIESDMSLPEVQECRGLILEKNTWKVMACSFFKFFNHGETNAAKIDWNTAKVLEKLDGSLISVYWDWNDNSWVAATTGTADGSGEVNNKAGTTFSGLFWDVIFHKNDDFRLSVLDKNVTYGFELTTPFNVVVKQHSVSSVTLLVARYNDSLIELTYEELIECAKVIAVPVVKAFDLNVNDFGALIRTFEGMPWSEEGYVVTDGNFNRVKIKNPAYLAVHHLKNKTAEHHIMTIIKSNEVEEFIATFIDRKAEVLELKEKYDKLLSRLSLAWDELASMRPMNITAAEKKKYAMAVFEVTKRHKLDSFTGLYFSLEKGVVSSINEYINEYDDKKLYYLL